MTAEAAASRSSSQKFPGCGRVQHDHVGLFRSSKSCSTTGSSTPTRRRSTSSSGRSTTPTSKANLTEERQRKLKRVDLATVPLDLAIKKVKGNGERTLIIFSYADCPFCPSSKNETKTVDNVTIYTFLFPIDSLHPDAARKSRMIWCSETA